MVSATERGRRFPITVLGFLILFITGCGEMNHERQGTQQQIDPEGMGNTPGNIANGGLVAFANGILYSSYTWNAEGLCEGAETEMQPRWLCDATGRNLNIIGQWIIYTERHRDGIFRFDKADGSLFRICEDEADTVITLGEWVYYNNYSDDERSIYKIKVDGSDKTRVGGRNVTEINIADGWIYFRGGAEASHIYKMRLDGSEETQVGNDDGRYLNVVDGWIYFRNESDSGKLYKMRVNGADRVKIADTPSWYINVHAGWVFYATESGSGQQGLFKVRTNGQGSTRLVSAYTHWINVTDEWVYFIDWNYRPSPGDSFRMRHDGSQRERLN